MASNPELNLDFKRMGNAGKGILCAKLGGEVLNTEKLDITDPRHRRRFASATCKGRAGISQQAVAQKLQEIAGQYVADGGDAEDQGRFTQAQALVQLADGVELFHCGDTAYATVEVGEGNAGTLGRDGSGPGRTHRETHALASKGFRLWLSRRFWTAYQKAPGAQAMQDALSVLSGRALFDGTSHPVAVRIAQHDGAVYLDLCSQSWQAVKLTANGWVLVDEAPVKFIRRRGMQPLPVPTHGGSLDDLRGLVNAGDDTAWRMIVAWLVGAFRPQGPYPVLAVNGEQGSAKSTTCRMLRRLIDPNEADLRAAPKDERDLMIAACNSWLVAFDNLSTIPAPLSDALCRLATGGGFATRELYTDDDEKLFNAARPIIFNGIEELATRPDLLERAIVLNLPTIHEEARRSEADLWRQYERVRPGILGAVLDAVAAALRNLSSVNLLRRPRMADFAEWVVAAEPSLPWQQGEFLNTYAANREEANELALEASSIGPAILGMMYDVYRWVGTAKELLAELETDRHTDLKTRQRQDWPKTPKGMSNALRRLAPTLRRLGVEVRFPPRENGGDRRRLIVLEQARAAPSQPSHTVPEAGPGVGNADETGRLGQNAASAGLSVPSRHTTRPFDIPQKLDGGEGRDGRDGRDGQIPICSDESMVEEVL